MAETPRPPFRLYQKLETDSRFLARITDPELRADVLRVTSSAADIATYVVRDMPQFTDHSGRHFLNVLSYMEFLAGPENTAALSELECALAVMAAFTHDLGMVLSDVERREISTGTGPRHAAWRSFLDTHRDKPRLDRLSGSLHTALEAQIRTDFLRRSHTDFTLTPGGDRITEWLRSIRGTPAGATGHAPTFRFHGFDYLQPLAWLGLSHGQPIYWLQQRLAKGAAGFSVPESACTDHRPVAGQRVHWLWLSWLLRLADVMDLDASRTPAILFDHIGIQNPISRIEWFKHLALPLPPEFHHGPDQETLLYTCGTCPAPEVERAIEQTVEWINDEIAKVRTAQRQHPSGRLRLDLPERAAYTITTRAGGYIYQNVEFTLRRDAVVELLMGEALYGEPTLALRELVQNALDALQMRKLRHDLRRRLRDAGTPYDHVCVDAVEEGEELRVDVTWGTAEHGDRAGQRYIRITDNGIGMDLRAVRQFLTQIGRSYYKSDEYLREVEQMREHGILCTTISQFGIGFLSSFMLADHITVRTRAAGARDDDRPGPDEFTDQQEHHRFPLRVEISSAHGLIAFYPDSHVTCDPGDCKAPSACFLSGAKHPGKCGTEVCLWLKQEFGFGKKPSEGIAKKLREEIYPKYGGPLYLRNKEVEPALPLTLDVAFEIARFVVWPLFPINLTSRSKGETTVTLEDKFHVKRVLPLDPEKFAALAQVWDCPIFQLDTRLEWQVFDWVDLHSSSSLEDFRGTGSRVRLAVVRCGSRAVKAQPGDQGAGAAEGLPQVIRSMFVEDQLPLKGGAGRGRTHRTIVLVAGIRIPELDERAKWMIIGAGVGAVVWIDLRGAACPRLRADRKGITRQQADACLLSIKAVQQRWAQSINRSGAAWQTWIRHAVAGLPPPTSAAKVLEWRLGMHEARLGVSGMLQQCSKPHRFVRDRILAEILLKHTSSDDGGMDLVGNVRDSLVNDSMERQHEVAAGLAGALLLGIECPAPFGINYSKKVDMAVSIAQDYGISFELKDDWTPALPPQRASKAAEVIGAFRALVTLHLLSEAFWPTLALAFPLFARGCGPETLNQCYLAGPLHIKAGSSRDARKCTPEWLSAFHLCSPVTGACLGGSWAFVVAKDEPESARMLRWAALSPFIWGEEVFTTDETGRKALVEALGTDHLLLFLPHPEALEKDFCEFTDDDRSKSASALWDITTGRVYYGDGVCYAKELRASGVSLDDWITRHSSSGSWSVKRDIWPRL